MGKIADLFATVFRDFASGTSDIPHHPVKAMIRSIGTEIEKSIRWEESSQPTNAATMLYLRDPGLTGALGYIDNVATIRNNTLWHKENGDTSMGNAAFRFVGGDGWEHGAMGYAALQYGADPNHPNVYPQGFGNYMFIECSNLQNGGPSNKDTNFGILTTFAEGSETHPAGLGYFACSYYSRSGDWTFRSKPGQPFNVMALEVVPVIGKDAVPIDGVPQTPGTLVFIMSSNKLRARHREALYPDAFFTSTNMDPGGFQDDAAHPSWMWGGGGRNGGGLDRFVVYRKPPGGGAFPPVRLMELENDGTLLVVKRRVNEAGTTAKTAGLANLVAGTLTINTTAVTALSRIHIHRQSVNGPQGAIGVSTRVAGTSFTVTSTQPTDTGYFAWEIVEPGSL